MIGFGHVRYLSERGYLGPHSRLLDIGSQNLLNLSREDVQWFVYKHGGAIMPEAAEQLASAASIQPGKATLYLSELMVHTDITYGSYDVCPGIETTIFDLNTDAVPEKEKGTFDVVLNIGTTEHVLHQFNAFKVIHEAAKVGGIIMHQVPEAGYTGHGYFAYRPQFFRDLAEANGYEILDIWHNNSGYDVLSEEVDFRDPYRPGVPASGAETHPLTVVNYNLNVVMRKTADKTFRCGLELATSHAAVDPAVAGRYAQAGVGREGRAPHAAEKGFMSRLANAFRRWRR
ncbi:hypothetical protein Sa4125_14930 [Aureimonas sp. SA4125]|uniref:class I SAM-dependent methyltransferase n=1 Tax=Aureimonas sp. SA4125 TaxID=2826993 RepID=UPI001CC65A33|nr:class I SAM-dependent methyltransferase [Aureimonas sp. SA4125]BDA83951.1 hypothetical protein Sa4125_14930 [Aureimonas sp. SA4125]